MCLNGIRWTIPEPTSDGLLEEVSVQISERISGWFFESSSGKKKSWINLWENVLKESLAKFTNILKSGGVSDGTHGYLPKQIVDISGEFFEDLFAK